MSFESKKSDFGGNSGEQVDVIDQDKDENAVKAAAFWRWKDKEDSAIEVVKTKMTRDIDDALLEGGGYLSVAVSGAGISEQDKQRLAAYHMIARDLGYNLGKFEFQKKTANAVARIERD